MNFGGTIEEIDIPLGPRRYSVLIGAGLINQHLLFDPWIEKSRVIVVTNEVVGPLYASQLLKTLPKDRTDVLTIPDGETAKTLQTWQSIHDQLIATEALRDTTLIALGGGVVGDVAGFAAATYMRGINYIQVPTTLLAQVDSSVGGKTGVNHGGGKNLIGAFHQPRLVVIDLDTLSTLPEREFRAGLAEVIKYGLIRDAGFLSWLQDSMEALARLDQAACAKAVACSVRHKSEVVVLDEREQGMRALLNLGHTFGHAIEALTGYEQFLHGEAVAIGMVLAADLSADLGMIARQDATQVKRLLDGARLPTRLPDGLTPAAMLNAMSLDKKNRAGQMRLILLEALGTAVVRDDVPRERLYQMLQRACKTQSA